MELVYKLKNLDALNAGNLEKYLSKIRKISDVKSAKIDGDTLILQVSADAYEYNVLETLIAVSDEFEVEVLFDEDSDNGTIDGDLTENESQEEGVEEADDEDEKGQELCYDDKLTAEKNALKKDALFRGGELCVSLILLVVSFFLKNGNGVFSLKMIFVIISFSLCGYDIVYNAFFDIIKKRPLAGNLCVLIGTIAMVILGEPTLATIVLFVYSCAKAVYDTVEKVQKLKVKSIFYTGSVAVKVGGEDVNRSEIKTGDVVTLVEGDIIPTDGELLCDAEISSYKVDYNYDTTCKKGDKLLAGSVVLSGEVTYVSKVNYGESYIDKCCESFGKKADSLGGTKTEKFKKIGLYVDLTIVFIALMVAFVLPVLAPTYKDGLTGRWGLAGAAILAGSGITNIILVLEQIFKNMYTEGFGFGIDFGGYDGIRKLGGANSFKVSAKALCVDNGTALNEDSIGALRELSESGVKKISTDFDFDINDQLKKKIDFVEPELKRENQVYFGDKEGDVALGGGKVNVMNGEISFVPLAYKMSKRSLKAARFASVFALVSKVALNACIMLVHSVKFSTVYFAIIGAAVTLLYTLFLFAGFTRNK